MGQSMDMHDSILAQEQAHLDETYAKLQATEKNLVAHIRSEQEERAAAQSDAYDDVRFNFSTDDDVIETLAELESVNVLIDSYSEDSSIAQEDLRRTRLSLRRPYFAKVTLRFRPDRPPRDIYLGVAGAVDEGYHHYIVDWRSPVAEVYYNQSNGATSYVADNRTIRCELLQRRQFDLDRNVLHNYFDTTVAIQDPLLLQSLKSRRSDKMSAITATIQKEQNDVVRHDDVPVLLVNGIAGSGKTSVLLQRIAFLLYRQRDKLRADQVYLFSPNPVFERYIDSVLPDMGEHNPHILTWASFVQNLGLADHGTGDDVPLERLRTLESRLEGTKLEARDLTEITLNGRRLLKLPQIQNTVSKFSRIPLGPRFSALVKEALHDKLDSRLAQLANDEDIHDEMLSMDVYDQVDIFGSAIQPTTEEETIEYAKQYVAHVYGQAHQLIEDATWLRIDRIGMRLLGVQNLTAVEWVYLKLLITGQGAPSARYVMIDEVQDYTEAQLLVLARYFGRAHFLLLGDEHQAIKESTATFPQIRDLFASTHGQVSECRLMTSYRSSPEITQLFCSLLDTDEQVQVQSVRREGAKPTILKCPDEQSWEDALLDQVDKAKAQLGGEDTEAGISEGEKDKENEEKAGGLVAVVGLTHEHAYHISKLLDIPLMDGSKPLPQAGIVVIDLLLAKGLEFDQVIIADADTKTYPDTPLARRRLYTAISRATQQVTVLSCGQLTPLLARD